jgi:hypothetical protein
MGKAELKATSDLALALTDHKSLWLAILADTGVTPVVTANGLPLGKIGEDWGWQRSEGAVVSA